MCQLLQKEMSRSTDQLVSETFFFVSSLNADSNEAPTGGVADNADIQIQIPEDALYCDPSEYMVITLEQHSMLNQLYNVNEGSITVRTVTQTLPAGSYQLCNLGTTLKNLNFSLVTWAFNPIANKWTVSTTDTVPVPVALSTDMARLLGFDNSFTIPALGSITSIRQALPTLYTELLLALSQVSMVPLNITNVGKDPDPNKPDQKVRATNTLGVIPIRSDPSTLNVFTNKNRTFSARIFGENINRMQFLTFDIHGDLVRNMPPWTATFKVAIYKVPEESIANKALTEILEFVRLLFMIAASSQGAEQQQQPVMDQQIVQPVLTPLEAAPLIESVFADLGDTN